MGSRLRKEGWRHRRLTGMGHVWFAHNKPPPIWPGVMRLR